MIFLGYSPYIIFTSFLTTLLLDRRIFVTGNKQFPTSSPWYPSGPSSESAKSSNDESEALKKVLPLVTFDCRGKTGYFPDSKFFCEVFHYCQPDGGRNTFHCPAHQLFNQLSMVCEEKTIHNSRLCREGSINSSKLQRLLPNNRKQHDVSQKTASPIFKPSLNANNSREPSKKVMTLEDLLSYMNSGHVGKEAEPTFISSFHNAEDTKHSTNPSESAITSTIPDTKSYKETTASDTTFSGAQFTAEGSDQSFSVTKVSKPKKKEGDEDVSAEYDAIEGRKFRKHKRLGRVIDLPANQQTKQDDKPSARSATEQTLADDVVTLSLMDEAESKNVSSHSLFTADRTRARDFRKRKRYQGRKRKVPTPESTNDTETGSASLAYTTTESYQVPRQDSDMLRNSAYRRRKSQRNRTRDGNFQGSSKSEKVEPYTLPPLPTLAVDTVDATTESTTKEVKRDPLKEGRSKNPWHKPTTVPADEAGYKFGEKLSDQHQFQGHEKNIEVPSDSDFYETKNIPNTSEELENEKSKDTVLMHQTISTSADMRSNHKPKVKTIPEEDNFKYGAPPEAPHNTVDPHIFPPPRAEAREHHSSTPQQMLHDSNTEKSKMAQNIPKTTTEDPFRVTHPYMGKYQTKIQELKDIEDQRWKLDSEMPKSKEKKLPVGSTFFFQNSDGVETTKKPWLRDSPSTAAPMRAPHKEKDTTKHTLAHQHLSKIMNDFFAMSSSNTPGRIPAHDEKEEEDLITPEYRIPDEDIYAGSESANDDMEEIPPELLEVVDLLTGHVSNENSNLKPRTSHEVIKINGPITDSHLEKIFMDDKFDENMDHNLAADGSYKQIVVVPQPEEKEEGDEDYKDIAEVAEFTSLKLESLLKHISDDKSSTVMPLKTEPVLKRQPKVVTAKQIPVRVVYRDQLTDTVPQKQAARQPKVKLLHSNLPTAHLQLSRNGGRVNLKPVTRTFSSHTRPSIILHPTSLFPPHPPPLPRKQLPFRVGYPFITNSRPFLQNTRQVPRRRKRSIISRLRRQIRQNQNFLPFSSPVFPAFNPKFLPTFSPFKSLFNPVSLHTAGSHLTPFSFPGFHIAKQSQNNPHVFQPSHQRPSPVRHVTQNGHQTVIVEEVPVPIHVEVPAPNIIRPAPPAAHPAKHNQRFQGNQYRTPSPPAIQTPPLIQRPRNRYPPPPPPPPPPANSYQPLGMPSNVRPPAMNYQPSIPFSAPLPPSITSQGQLYALGVTNKPLSPPNPRPARPPGPNSARNPPRPYNPFDIHASSYPNFPYFHGAFTTPISNEPIPGRLMYSGYKPPKSTSGTKSPKPRTHSNKERKPSESQSTRSRSKPNQDYFEVPARPMRESHVSYTEEVISRGRPRTKPNLNDFSADHSDFKSPRQNLSKGPSSDESTPRKRRPGKRRRPRPYSTTTQGTTALNDISPTPPPPEQIPPPPADYTSKPAHLDVMNSLPSFNEGTKTQETSSHFPPAGYYGKDQLIQFFDSSSKAYQKTTSPRPHNHKDLGENTSSAELDESFTSMSGEDGNEPAFGTRLRSKPQSQSRSRQSKNRQPAQSQSQNTEIRTRPITRINEATEQRKRGNVQQQQKPNEGSRTQMKNENTPPKRRRPPPPRPRSRPPPMPQSQPGIHHFNYNENMGNFYTVPRGLQTLVAPSDNPSQGFRGSTDMFGLPHPVIDQSIYSLRPQGAPDFDPNFFSVPAHVAQQQQSPLHKMNIKPVPESAKEFFTAPETGVTIPEASAPEKKETEPKSPQQSNSEGENKEQKEKPPVRKLRKPKRKNRYNPHSNEQKDSAEVNGVKPQLEQTTPRDSYIPRESNTPRESYTPRENNTPRYKEKTTTSAATTTPEPRSTAAIGFHSQNDIKESPTYKQRTPLLPKTLPEFSKPLLNGKIDFQKLNATISTSVSVSGSVPQNNNTSSEERESKRVFSSQNGGLAVVRKGPKRKRARQRVSTTTGVPYVNNESSTDAKYEIAASVLDIIKATTETERQASGYYNKNENPAPSSLSNVWVESKRTR